MFCQIAVVATTPTSTAIDRVLRPSVMSLPAMVHLRVLRFAVKICSKCKRELPRENFYPRKNRPSGLDSNCKECYRAMRVKYRSENKDIIRAQNKRRVPGWDIDRYNLYVELQGNVCAICGTSNPRLADWCADHCHTTMKPRGLLCVNCNAGLGYFKDNLEYLQSAIDYLNKWREST